MRLFDRTRGNRSSLLTAGLAVLGASLTLSACAVDDAGSGSGSTGESTVKVGIVTSTTGPYASQGASFINGFQAGLDYLTQGTGKVGNTKIDVEIANDNGDPATGTAAAKKLLGEGAKFLMGATNSAVALPVSELAVQNQATYLSGASGSSALLGKNANIFVTGSGSWLPNQAVFKAVPGAKKIVFIGQDYQYGQDQAALLKKTGAALGIETDSVLMPSSTQDFTGGVLKAKSQNPDLLFIGWQGDGTAQLYQALADQGLYKSTKILTIVSSRPSVPAFAAATGDQLDKTLVLGSYFEGVGGGDAEEQAMIAYAKKTNVTVDYVHPQGFIAAQMVKRAIESSGGDLTQPAVAKALDGYSFETPMGQATIEPGTHLITVPVYSLRFTKAGDGYTAEAVATYAGAELAADMAKVDGS